MGSRFIGLRASVIENLRLDNAANADEVNPSPQRTRGSTEGYLNSSVFSVPSVVQAFHVFLHSKVQKMC